MATAGSACLPPIVVDVLIGLAELLLTIIAVAQQLAGYEPAKSAGWLDIIMCDV